MKCATAIEGSRNGSRAKEGLVSVRLMATSSGCCSRRPSTGGDDALGRLVTLGLSMQRRIPGEPLGHANDLLAQQPQLAFDELVLHGTGLGEDPRRLGHWDHVGDGPPA